MKRLIPLCATLALVSCDSGTKHTEGTSSETQTALQALADNVREIPRGPGGTQAPLASPVAGRAMDVGESRCMDALRWIQGAWLQAEFYDGLDWFAWPKDTDAVLAWRSVRNEFATDEQGNELSEPCPTGPMKARTSDMYRVRGGELVAYTGYVRRDGDSGGMTSVRWEGVIRYPSGFELRSTVVKSGPNLFVETDTLQEWTYSFEQGRYSFRFSSGLPGNTWISRDSTFCAAVLDHANFGRQVGSVCGTRNLSQWTIRDAYGAILPPQGVPAPAYDDSMGVRVLSTRWDGDSLRIRFRVRTAPFSLRQWSRTSIVVGDSSKEGASGSIKPLDKEFVFPDTNFVGPESVEMAFAAEDLANHPSLRVELIRVYWRPTDYRSTIGTWWFRIPPRDE